MNPRLHTPAREGNPTGLERRRRRAGLEGALLNLVGRCNKDHRLIEDGDRILVGLSGGKDSYTLMHLLERLRRRAPVRFDLVGVTLDQGHPGFPGEVIEGWARERGFEFDLIRHDTYSVVLEKVPEGKTYCSLCSRLRRGILYRHAGEKGCNKIALGHHRDDVIETLLLNLFYAGQLKAMPPRLTTDDGRFQVIRPLAYAAEDDIAELATLMAFPIVPCNLCGSQDGLKRQEVKALLSSLSKDNPNVKGNLLAALGNVVPSHLMDPTLVRRG